MKIVPTIETERLILREFRNEDLDDFAAFMGDEKSVAPLHMTPRKRPESWRIMADHMGQWILKGCSFFCVEEKTTGKVIGRVGCHYPEGWPGIECGWGIASDYWGKGYAPEAAKGAINWLFSERPNQERMISLILPENHNSQRVAQKLGMTLSGEQFIHWDIGAVDIWAISREDWYNSQN